jgi:alpha-beta hydrolase superfamily lysophospholipase
MTLSMHRHSMGGAIAALTAKERPNAWAGVVLSGAAIKKGADVNALTVHAARYVASRSLFLYA